MSSQAKLKVALIIILCIAVCSLVLGVVMNADRSYDRLLDTFGGLSIGDDEEVVELADRSEPLSKSEFEGSDVKSIRIDWAAGGVDVRMSEAPEDGIVRVTEYARGSSRQQPMRAICEEGTLSIDYNTHFSLFSGCSFGHKIAVIELPRSVAGSLDRFELNGASGRYDLTDMGCGYMRLHIASGKIRCSDVAIEDLDIDITSGTLEMTASVEGNVGIHITSGNINLACVEQVPKASDITMTSGTVEVACKRGAPSANAFRVTSGHLAFAIPNDSGFQAVVDKISGSFACNLPCENAGDAYYAGDRSKRFDISMTSGNVMLEGISAT